MTDFNDVEVTDGFGNKSTMKGFTVAVPTSAANGTHIGERNEHVYQTFPDARQSMDPAHKPSRFRPTYRPLTIHEVNLHRDLKEAATALEAFINQAPPGRYQSMALTALEEAVMWAVKGITE